MQALLDAIAQMPFCTDAQRVFHGRGGLYPGCEQISLDAFPPVILLTSFAPMDEAQLSVIGLALEQRWQQIAPAEQPLVWAFQTRESGGRVETRIMAGELPEPHVVTESAAKYLIHIARGQNHGLFLDMAAGRDWVRQQVLAHARPERMKVLNLFAYTCAFSVVAKLAGAGQVLNMDMSKSALATGQHNHQINGVKAGASFAAHDIFSSWGKINRSGPYDLIIADPPSYQKGSFIATKDYARLMRRLPDLLVPEGQVLLCLNAPELGTDFLREQMSEIAAELKFVERLANPPVFADVNEECSLKVLVYRAPGLDAAAA
ncbi:class I SAM-dependent methyltransferase [Comamonas sp. Y33R10-2]|uniref:class I SAM-dependent methyltransferase n=1 Tax=Comamonas sp. Y33R10-2 TaxID=2853257 RepID=UPI001C5C9DB3|nr:class I SAM-dependent methyltransferase [Comamonas sp. Y33R10-2]QXZ11031.1 class I SAM-dependent methyltransferase [Comamonas sp. Y33R10-2]